MAKKVNPTIKRGGKVVQPCPVCSQDCSILGLKNHVRLKHPSEYPLHYPEAMTGGQPKPGAPAFAQAPPAPEGMAPEGQAPEQSFVAPEPDGPEVVDFTRESREVQVVVLRGEPEAPEQTEVYTTEEMFSDTIKGISAMLKSYPHPAVGEMALTDQEADMWCPGAYRMSLKYFPGLLNMASEEMVFIFATVKIFAPKYRRIKEMGQDARKKAEAKNQQAPASA